MTWGRNDKSHLMSDVPPQEVPVNRVYEESEVEYLLALCMRMGLGQWAALANNAAPWRMRTALGSIIVNSEHGSWLGICAKYCGMNTADWLAAVRKLREEVLKKYAKYDTPVYIRGVYTAGSTQGKEDVADVFRH